MASRVKQISNEELVREYEYATARMVNYPNNKSIAKEHDTLEAELLRRLNEKEEN